MSKRQLDSKYKDLVEYVNDKHSEFESLATILKRAIKEGNKMLDGGNPLWDILNPLYTTTLDSDDFSDLTKTIVDIYNGNYELQEPKYYWRFNLQGVSRTYYYAVRIESLNGRFGLDEYKYDESRFTENELIDALSNTDTNLAINDFIPVEV